VRIVGGAVPRGLLAAANGMRFPGTRVKPMFPAIHTVAKEPARVAD
jgi:hypothetical protein